MTRLTSKLVRRFFAPVAGVLFVAGGLATAGTANATPNPGATPGVTVENFDTSEFVEAPSNLRKRGGGDCEGSSCTPITWCDDKDGRDPGKGNDPDKVALPAAKGIIAGDEGDKGNGPKGGDKPHKPDCLKVPSVKIDGDDCCKNPPGGTIIITIDNPNDQPVPAQVTVKYKGKDYTENGWVKPGKSKVKLKKLPNGWYGITVHLGDCVFKHGHKVVRVKCETVEPTPTETTTTEPTPTATATVEPTPTDTTDAPVPGSGGGDNNNGGGGELALTGANAGTIGGGGAVLLALGLGIVFLARRRKPRFSA